LGTTASPYGISPPMCWNHHSSICGVMPRNGW
jgi:hypothetical protein